MTKVITRSTTPEKGVKKTSATRDQPSIQSDCGITPTLSPEAKAEPTQLFKAIMIIRYKDTLAHR